MKTHMNELWEDIVDNKEVIILLSLVWLILFEQFTIGVALSGVLMSILVVIFTDRFLLKGNYEHSYMIGLGTLAKYVFRLIIEIYLAGIDVIPNIISGKADVQIITCQTKLTDELLIDILANSITLTPGTVTVEKKGSTLQVLALNAPGVGDDPRVVIPLKLEDILLRYEETLDGKA
ncbi:Na+/H+ antiporter subunit E [Alkalibacterium thalassium]|uniref:Multicomponent Na+:H+ antiporter subunit E n=1 Tax=Alkalibacterium thalassium TaxID=426701 RepID=A0A1G8V5K8_9LACT|nr:Na+/H+ antiporter subunit E [Alkalibacterium thalassium]SDJ61323.1 multicomponent Na+:H+ antiporter subunit E [Alkalibacterium thalassium]